METQTKPLKWLSIVTVAAAVAGCGGGGGGESPIPAPTPDVRSGDYTMFAADAKQYTLSLDFDAKTYHIVGNGSDDSGSFAGSGTDFTFVPTGPAPVENNARFSQFSDTVVGGFRFGGNVTPFIASRDFVTSVAEAAGAYKFLTTTVDPAAAPNNAIFTGEIVSPGTFRFCSNAAISTIANCPAASVSTATLTVSGPDFRADFGALGAFPFRVAKVGTDKVFLRASASNGTSRRFYVGVDENNGYADAVFNGVNNDGQATRTTVTATSVTATQTSEANVQTSVSGIPAAAIPGLLVLRTATDGNFFSMRTTDLGFVFAAANNPVHPGYVEIGKK